jgi:hypothetical protein
VLSREATNTNFIIHIAYKNVGKKMVMMGQGFDVFDCHKRIKQSK